MVIVGSTPSVLAGVSQQVPRERLPGQLSEQLNMLSDPVTGLRRRPGFQLVFTQSGFTADPLKIMSQYVEVDQVGFNVFIDTEYGKMYAFSRDFSALLSTVQNDYLKAANAKSIRITNVGGYGWLANLEKQPSKGPVDSTKKNPIHDGFFYIRTGAFQKTYAIHVEGGGTWDFSYTTDSTAANSTPEGIATNLYNSMVASTSFVAVYDTTRVGAYVFITKRVKAPTSTSICTVTSSSGQVYIMTSQAMRVALVSDLPAKLPDVADGSVLQVGTSKTAMTYYRWTNSTASWDETGDYASAASFLNMPIRFIVSTAGILTVDSPTYQGRTAGDDYNNPYHHFIQNSRITGIGTFQGRLVILSGAYTSLSDSTDPTRFTRVTVASVLATDAIETGSGSASSASFEYAIQFNRDLLLIASTHQAVIPTNTQAISNTNALVVLSNKVDLDTTAAPVVIGRTLMACAPTSAEYFGVVEFQPSAYTASQYTPQNLTDHIPRFIKGRARHIVGSNTSSIALYTSSVDLNEILVNEYLWDGAERKQSSWHKWTTPLPIGSLHFARDTVIIGMLSGSNLMVCTCDVRASTYLGSKAKPFLDCWRYGTVTDNTVTVDMKTTDETLLSKVALAQSSGDMAGEPIGIASRTGTAFKTMRSYPSGEVAYGYRFTSRMAPTPPMMRDKNDVVISTAKTTVLRYDITTQRSGEFTITVTNGVENPWLDENASAMKWSSVELDPGKPLVAGLGNVIIPCRTLAHETVVVLSTDGTRELNILDVEYTLRAEVRPDRRRL